MREPALLDMLNAARAAVSFAAGVTFEQLMADEMRQAAILFKLTVLGEAAKRISQPVRDGLPGIPWRSAAGVRDKLVHEYHRIALKTVWGIVQDDLPPLIAALEQLDLEKPE